MREPSQGWKLLRRIDEVMRPVNIHSARYCREGISMRQNFQSTTALLDIGVHTTEILPYHQARVGDAQGQPTPALEKS